MSIACSKRTVNKILYRYAMPRMDESISQLLRFTICIENTMCHTRIPTQLHMICCAFDITTCHWSSLQHISFTLVLGLQPYRNILYIELTCNPHIAAMTCYWFVIDSLRSSSVCYVCYQFTMVHQFAIHAMFPLEFHYHYCNINFTVAIHYYLQVVSYVLLLRCWIITKGKHDFIKLELREKGK